MYINVIIITVMPGCPYNNTTNMGLRIAPPACCEQWNTRNQNIYRRHIYTQRKKNNIYTTYLHSILLNYTIDYRQIWARTACEPISSGNGLTGLSETDKWRHFVRCITDTRMTFRRAINAPRRNINTVCLQWWRCQVHCIEKISKQLFWDVVKLKNKVWNARQEQK